MPEHHLRVSQLLQRVDDETYIILFGNIAVNQLFFPVNKMIFGCTHVGLVRRP
jgi:hypothetical protein